MNTRRIRNPINGQLVEAEVVNVIKETNSAVVLELEDGAVLRLKIDIAEVARIPDTLNSFNEPFYVIKSNNSITLLGLPDDHLI